LSLIYAIYLRYLPETTRSARRGFRWHGNEAWRCIPWQRGQLSERTWLSAGLHQHQQQHHVMT